MKARLWGPKVFLLILFIFTLVSCTKGVVPGSNFFNFNNNNGYPFVDGGSFDGMSGFGYFYNPSRTPALASYNNQLYVVSAGGASGGVDTYLYNGNDGQPNWNHYGFSSPQPTPGLATNPSLSVYNSSGNLYGTWSEANTGSTYPSVTQIYVGYLAGTSWNYINGVNNCGTVNCLNFAPGQNAVTPTVVASTAAIPGINVFWSETAATGGSTIQGGNSATGANAWTPISAPLNRNLHSVATNPHAIFFGGQIYVAWSENGANNTGPSVIHVDTSTDGIAFATLDGGASLPTLSQSGTGNGTNPFLVAYSGNIYLSWIGNFGGANLVRAAMYNGTSWEYVDGAGLNYNSGANAVGTPKMVVGPDGLLDITWTEIFSGVTQVRVKRFNGSTWDFMDGGGSTGLNFMTTVSTADPSLTLFNGKIYSAWEEFNVDLTRVRVVP